MKKSILTVMCTLLVVCFLSVIGGCGSDTAVGINGTSLSKETGNIAVSLDWNPESKTTAKNVALAPTGVATVRAIVSGSDFSTIQSDFSAAAGAGIISGVLAGTGRTVTAQGLDSAGIVTYEGSLSNITVTAGQTTNAGTITMNPVTRSISGTITLNGSGLAGVAVALTGGITTTTDSTGAYTFTGIQSGTYTVTPTLIGYTFTAPTLSVIVTNANVSGKNFTATNIGSISSTW